MERVADIDEQLFRVVSIQTKVVKQTRFDGQLSWIHTRLTCNYLKDPLSA
jgi:hypothetical protein